MIRQSACSPLFLTWSSDRRIKIVDDVAFTLAKVIGDLGQTKRRVCSLLSNTLPHFEFLHSSQFHQHGRCRVEPFVDLAMTIRETREENQGDLLNDCKVELKQVLGSSEKLSLQGVWFLLKKTFAEVRAPDFLVSETEAMKAALVNLLILKFNSDRIA